MSNDCNERTPPDREDDEVNRMTASHFDDLGRTDEPPIFGLPAGNWFNMAVEQALGHPLIDLKVYLDQDPTSDEAIWLVGFEDMEADYNLVMVTIPDQESTDWSAVEEIIATTISDESHPQSKWIFCGESRLEYDEELMMAQDDISEDRIGQLSPDEDWNLGADQYQD